MKHTRIPLILLAFLTIFSTAVMGDAFNSSATEKKANLYIKELYHRLNSMPNSSMSQRIDWISGQFLGRAYLLGSLGEGPQAQYDQFPQYRIDAFDCETYVTTVLSLALANSLNSFQHCIKNIRYKNGNVSYIQRNHFTGLDWNQNNQRSGLLKDITLTVKDQNHQLIAKIAKAMINKPNWYAYKTLDTIRLENATQDQAIKRLAELKQEGSKLEITPEKVPYLPLTALVPANNQPNKYLLRQIPNGAIIEIIRPNWNLTQKIGTSLTISHLGFAIRKKGQLYFREASSQYGKVIDVPLIEYLEQAKSSPTIKGINIQVILPKKPLPRCKVPI